MWPIGRRPVSLTNARVVVDGGVASSIRFSRRILGIDEGPVRGDVVVDLEGAFVLPGLVNAHDHLELNHFGRLKFREKYENASQWIEDLRPRLSEDPRIRAGREHSLADRLFAGGLKNLLAGVTTVAHHNPRYRELLFPFPVRTVRRYGFAHSFFLQGKPVGARGEKGTDVFRAHRRTRAGAPFLVHLAEGVDENARRELGRLDALGCLDERTVIVHGVALSPRDLQRVVECESGLVWCPSSNHFLFGRTAPVRQLLDGGFASVALGTDSRLTGSRDLLEELAIARAEGAAPSELLPMVTSAAARLLRLPKAGRLDVGLPADFVVVPPRSADAASALVASGRSELRLVAIGGRPLVGAPELSRVFEARSVDADRVELDSEVRLLDRALVRRARSSPIREPGLALDPCI